ncbi:MAG: hypothetical protein ACPGVG_00390 [Mycobacterium sp.]
MSFKRSAVPATKFYDFRNPATGGPTAVASEGFGWSSIDRDWKAWSPPQFLAALQHPLSLAGFANDWNAMNWADTFVLLAPCGRSAHLEVGWAVGAGKPTCIRLADGEEPELMYKMAFLVDSDRLLLEWLEGLS